MEYRKIINFLDDTTNEASKFRTRNCVEINDKSRGTYNVTNEIDFKTSMIRSNLCDYSNAYIHVKGTLTVPNTSAQGVAPNNRNEIVIFKHCVPFINCRSEINNIQVDDAHDIDGVMPMYNLIDYSDTYSKTSGSLWRNYRDKPDLKDNGNIIDFPNDDNNSILFNFKR